MYKISNQLFIIWSRKKEQLKYIKISSNFIFLYFAKAIYSESEKNGLFETIRVINEYLPMRKFVEKFFRRLAKLTIDYEGKELTQKLYKKILGW